MTIAGSSAASTVRGRVSTGYGGLDETLRGGFLAGSAILLSAPASSEVPIIVRNFLKASNEVSLLICRSQSSAEAVSRPDDTNLKCMICSEKPIPPSKNMLPGKGIDNLTELNFQITETISSVQPKRIVLEILSDILLRHKAVQTRKWLNEFLEKLRSKGITTLAVLNPYMHPNEEVQAVVDLFDGNLELVEKDIEGQLQKFLRIKWVHGLDVAENELSLLDLTPERLEPSKQQAAAVTHFKEPRWLTSLVGRMAELSKLKVAFETAFNGISSVVALQGEAGVGKTRLMQELAVYAQSKGNIVLTGSAMESGLPYAPWVEEARQYLSQAPGELLRRMLGPRASELVKLVPDIAAKLGTIPPSKPLGEQQDKIRFYEAVTQFFISICTESSLLLLFDDMHLVDQSSLELLEYFVRSTSNLRVLTICSYRVEDVQADSPLYRTLMKLNKQRLLETIQVKNLSKEETAELIKQTFGETTISSEFADLIYNRTGGNPFFVEEVLRSLVEDGTIFRTESKWDRKPIQEIVLPESVKSVLKSRLTKLQPETLNLLTMASVIGSEFDFEVLHEVSQLEEELLLQRLETAFSAGLVQQIPRQKSIFKFTDDRIRELLLNDLIPMRRGKYHLKIAEAMQKVYSKNLEGQAEVVANHFSEGGDTERTIKYSIMAGDRNRTIHAYELAIADYKRALGLIEPEQGREAEKAGVLEKLAGCYNLVGQAQDSVRNFQQALSLYEELHDFKACARISVNLPWALFRARPSGIREGIAVLRQAFKYVEEDRVSYEAAAIYSSLAGWLASLNEYDEANTWAGRALEAGEKSGNFAAVVETLATRASLLSDSGRIDESLHLLERAFDMALQHDLQPLAINLVLPNLILYTYWRDFAKGRELVFQGLEVSKREYFVPAEAGSRVWLSYLDWLRGDWAVALEEVNRALEMAQRLGFMNDYILFGEVWRGLIHLSMGDLEEAEKYLNNSDVKENPQITHVVNLNLTLGKIRLEQGREDEAKACFETCVNAFIKWEFSTIWPQQIETLLNLTLIYTKQRRLNEARKMSEWTRRLAEIMKGDACFAMASQAEASRLLATGERKGAEEAYLKSLALWERAGWPYYHAKALVGYWEAIAQTNPEEAKKRLQQAAEIFKKLGAKRDLQKAENMLQS